MRMPPVVPPAWPRHRQRLLRARILAALAQEPGAPGPQPAAGPGRGWQALWQRLRWWCGG